MSRKKVKILTFVFLELRLPDAGLDERLVFFYEHLFEKTRFSINMLL